MYFATAMEASFPLAMASPRSSSRSVTDCPCARNMMEASDGRFTAQLSFGSGTVSSRDTSPFATASKTTYISTSFVIDAGGISMSAFFSKSMLPVSLSMIMALSAFMNRSAGIVLYGKGVTIFVLEG